MSADLLRRAAAKLRETAAKATPGLWHVAGLPWNDRIPYVIAGHPDPHAGTFVADPEHLFMDSRGNEADDAAWIALANPALADPLAAWLEREARHWSAVDTCGAVRPGPEGLAVARAILGEVPNDL